MEGNDFAVGSVGPEPLLVLSSPDEDMHQPAVTTENLLQLHSELLRVPLRACGLVFNCYIRYSLFMHHRPSSLEGTPGLAAPRPAII